MDPSSDLNSPASELFVDLNCPFCFCQVERLVRHDLTSMVTWKGIEHEPELPLIARQAHPLSQTIPEELATLKEREPSLVIANPGVRPNVRRALDFLVAVQTEKPDAFWPTLLMFYRALWQDGSDISKKRVVVQLAERAKVADVEVTSAHQERRRTYTREWLAGPFEERLPVARSKHGPVLLGLNDEQRFVLFLKSGLISVRGGLSC